MKIIFMGTPEFAIPSLEAIHHSSHELLAVVTAPDKPVGRGLKIQASPVKKVAHRLGVPVLQPGEFKSSEFIRALQEFKPELSVVVAFRILPPEVFRIPPKGTINLHASLLPKYRGAAPINWAIIKGEKETGLSTIIIQEQVDAGDLILQKPVAIGDDETAGELHDRLALSGAELLLETLARIENGVAQLQFQTGEITKAPKLTRELMRIRWDDDADKIRNLIRGLSPSPGAFSFLNSKLVKLLRGRVVDSFAPAEPGKVVQVELKTGRVIVGCGRRQLEITELQIEGKRPMTTKEYLIGHRLHVDDKFD
ncbi:MAG TPA: methionyl-tRNA formyltransferase [bacterium]